MTCWGIILPPGECKPEGSTKQALARGGHSEPEPGHEGPTRTHDVLGHHDHPEGPTRTKANLQSRKKMPEPAEEGSVKGGTRWWGDQRVGAML